jgi:hypothetical protein
MTVEISDALRLALDSFANENRRATLICKGMKIKDGVKPHVTVALFQLSLTHSVAIAELINANHISSAQALHRAQFEAYVRGMWVALCADEVQAEAFANGAEPPKFTPMTAAIDAKLGTDTLTNTRKAVWGQMNDFYPWWSYANGTAAQYECH